MKIDDETCNENELMLSCKKYIEDIKDIKKLYNFNKFMKKIFSVENIEDRQRIHNNIKKYMKTEEYINGLDKYSDINLLEKFKNYKDDYGKTVYIRYTDIEKSALIIKHLNMKEKIKKHNDIYMAKNIYVPGTEYIYFSLPMVEILVPMKEFTKIHGDILDIIRKNSFTKHYLNNRSLHFISSENFNSPKLSYFFEGLKYYTECWKLNGKILYCPLKKNNNFDMNVEKQWYVKSIITNLKLSNKIIFPHLEETEFNNGCSLRECFVYFE
jgi:hypothetical protein